MTNCYLIKYGEIGIKGKNRNLFEDALARHIRRALASVGEGYTVRKERGRIYVDCPEGYDAEASLRVLTHIFGIVGICPVHVAKRGTPEELRDEVLAYLDREHPDFSESFKVHARRIDKSFPLTSMETDAYIGDAILSHCPKARVDVHTPERMIDIELRENIYLYSRVIPGPGGMPVGTNGKAMLLLSGGIDSPVAGYRIAKRGVFIDAVYFHAPPYTSERAKEKVIDLARQVAVYAGPIRLYVVNFTDIQLAIYDNCPHEELTIIMRRYMMRIAEHFAKQTGCLGLVTGESIGQVASQTMQSLMATDAAATLPVYRPLIGFDKQEIVETAKEIGTYETSILPYEDCCTIFVAKHPVTKPEEERIARSEKKLIGIAEPLVEAAIESAECLSIEGEIGRKKAKA